MKTKNPSKWFRLSRKETQVKKFSKKLMITGATLLAFLVASVAFAAWVVTGSGDGYAKATSSQALYTDNVGATTVAQLYPGGSGDVKVTVRNPNPFPVEVTQVSANGAVSGNANCTDVGADPLKATGVSFTTQNLVAGNVVPAKSGGTDGTLALTLSNAAAMSNASVNACQGATFTIPVTFTAASN